MLHREDGEVAEVNVYTLLLDFLDLPNRLNKDLRSGSSLVLFDDRPNLNKFPREDVLETWGWGTWTKEASIELAVCWGEYINWGEIS